MNKSRKKKHKHALARNGVRDLPVGVYTLATGLMKTLRFTWRIKIDDRARILQSQSAKPFIFASWHNRLMFIPTVTPKWLLHRTAGLASNSRDGEYAAQMLMAFGMQMVRGSTSKGGYRALIRMQNKLKAGVGVALTPDGPRGPRYEVQPGAVILAERTGRQIVPMSLNSNRYWELKGWDRTQIPKPFANVQFILDTPIDVPPNLTPEQREQQCARLKQALMNISDMPAKR